MRVAGCAVTPVGSPAMTTAIVPVNPLAAVAFTLICCPVAPGTSVITAGVDAKAKSPSDAGLDPPLQEIKARQTRKLEHTLSVFEKEYISTPPVDEQELRSHLFLRLPARQNEGTPVFSSGLSRSCLLFVKCGELHSCLRNVVRTTKE
jgi:hypothetical protein